MFFTLVNYLHTILPIQLELLTRKAKLLWPQAASQNTTNDIHWVGLMHKSHLCLEKSQGLFFPMDKALLHPNESNSRAIKLLLSPSCLSFFIAYFMAGALCSIFLFVVLYIKNSLMMIRKYKPAALHDFIMETAFEKDNYKEVQPTFWMNVFYRKPHN